MITNIVEKLIDNSLTLGILGIGLYFMWKENSTYRKKQDADLEKVKEELHAYFTSDMSMLKDIVVLNTEAMVNTKEVIKENNNVVDRCNNVMECLIKEIKKVKPEFVNSQKT